MKATHSQTGVTVTADEKVIRNLGPGWVADAEPPKRRRAASKKAPAKSDGDD